MLHKESVLARPEGAPRKELRSFDCANFNHELVHGLQRLMPFQSRLALNGIGYEFFKGLKVCLT